MAVEATVQQEPTDFPTSTSPVSSPEEVAHQTPTTQSSSSSMILLRIMSKRRTWVCLFVGVYTLLLFLSWNLLKSVLSWYESTLMNSSSSGSIYTGLPALYASVLLGMAFGVLSMVAALAVVVPATLITWITVLVLLTFFGKPRRALVMEGKKLTADITGFVVKVLIKEGNIVAALCAVLGYFAFVRKSRENNGIASDY